MTATARKNPFHSAKSCEHGTGHEAVDIGRHTLGAFDLDPSSSAYWNEHVVKAAKYYDRRANCMKQRWFGRVWINPAGADEDADTDSLVAPCWERLMHFYRAGDVTAAIWYGYSLQQLQGLQQFEWNPSRFPTLLFAKRQRHLERPRGGGPPVREPQPMHAQFMTLVYDRRSPTVRKLQLERFIARGSKHGQIVRPL